jgi:hypothetical protein
MAEPAASPTSPTDASANPAHAAPRQGAPHIVLRVLLGFSGLALLVGFFLPWFRVPGAEGTQATLQSGYALMTSGDLAGTPALLLLVVPILGAVLSATAFMGFRFSGEVAVGVAVLLIVYALYVLLQVFVQHTGEGLWIVAGSTLVILLLGVITWMLGRDKGVRGKAEAGASSAGVGTDAETGRAPSAHA